VANVQPAFPDPRPLPTNTPQPSAGRNQAARSQEYEVHPIREPTAIAASKVCRPSNDQHRFQDKHPLRGQHQRCPLAEASASTVAVEAVIIQVSKSIDFYFHDLPKKIISDENKLVHRVAADVVAVVRLRPNFPDADAASSHAG
jgi:hypothetical protein